MAVAALAATVSFVAVFRGETLCLCDEDPDGCGQVCHDCGTEAPDGFSDGPACLHLDIASPDLAAAETAVRLPSVGAMPAPSPIVLFPSRPVRPVTPSAASPPVRIATYCALSDRLYPRS